MITKHHLKYALLGFGLGGLTSSIVAFNLVGAVCASLAIILLLAEKEDR